MKFAEKLDDSIELRFSSLARIKNQNGEPIISLGLGEPAFPTPPEIVEAACQAMREGLTRYSSPFGLMDLRDAISRKLLAENGVTTKTEEVMVTHGAKMALSLVLAAILQPGDEVIIITPCYTSYVPQIRIAEPDAVIRNLDLRPGDFGLDIERMEALMTSRTKAIIVNFPHNPTGRMLSNAELEGITKLLIGHDCWLISDEIYERLNFSGIPHLSPGAVPALSERTITINGFSKAFSMTGWRIGYLVAKGGVMKTISKLQQHMNTNVAPFIQKAALVALSLPPKFLADYNGQLAANACALAEMVDSIPQLRLNPSEGGLFAFLDISKTGLGSDAFCSGLLEKHAVAATPGVVFGRTWDNYVRISLATDIKSFEQGMSRLAEFSLATAKYE